MNGEVYISSNTLMVGLFMSGEGVRFTLTYPHHLERSSFASDDVSRVHQSRLIC